MHGNEVDSLQPIVNVPPGTSSISMFVALCRTLHGKPVALIAFRSVISVTTAASTFCSMTVYGTTNVKAFVAVAVPPGVVKATLFAPAVPAGVTAVTLVDETTTTLVAATPPTVTLVAPVKLVPVIVIAVPPAVEPDVGETDETVGGAKYVNAFVAVAVPFGVVTATLVAPTVPAGVTAVTLVDETTTTLAAATPPTITLVAPVKLVPVIVIAVPPAVEPVAGETKEIVGGAKYVNAFVAV
ncbi:MAG: hypothetical protein RLZZ386_588, partial [Planctomycetota bacterium]